MCKVLTFPVPAATTPTVDLAGIKVGDRLRVVFVGRSNKDESRTVSVTSLPEKYIYTTSGKTRVTVGGGALWRDGEKIYFQPTLSQQVGIVKSVDRVS